MWIVQTLCCGKEQLSTSTGCCHWYKNAPTCTYDSINNLITLTNIVTGSNLELQTLTINIAQVRNPPSIKPTDSFNIKTYYTSDSNSLVAEGPITGITPSIGSIDSASASVESDSDIVYDSDTTYDLIFQNTY